MTIFLTWVYAQTCHLTVGCICMPWYVVCWVKQACEHAYLIMFLPCPVNSTKSENLLSFAILPWCFKHVLVVSCSSSVIMFCSAWHVLQCHAIGFHLPYHRRNFLIYLCMLLERSVPTHTKHFNHTYNMPDMSTYNMASQQNSTTQVLYLKASESHT